MLDPKLLRVQIDVVKQNLERRGFVLDADAYAALEEQRKALQVRVEELRNERNVKSKSIGRAKAAGENVAALLGEVQSLGDGLKAADAELDAVQVGLRDLQMGLPNMLDDSVPAGRDESDNLEIRTWGSPTSFSFDVRDHVDLGTQLGMLDFDAAAAMTGARFSVMRGTLARLHRALIQYMQDLHTLDNGYTEIYAPYIVNANSQ